MRKNSRNSGPDVNEVQFRANLLFGVGEMKVPGRVGGELDGPFAGEHSKVDSPDIPVKILEQFAGD